MLGYHVCYRFFFPCLTHLQHACGTDNHTPRGANNHVRRLDVGAGCSADSPTDGKLFRMTGRHIPPAGKTILTHVCHLSLRRPSTHSFARFAGTSSEEYPLAGEGEFPILGASQALERGGFARATFFGTGFSRTLGPPPLTKISRSSWRTDCFRLCRDAAPSTTNDNFTRTSHQTHAEQPASAMRDRTMRDRARMIPTA